MDSDSSDAESTESVQDSQDSWSDIGYNADSAESSDIEDTSKLKSVKNTANIEHVYLHHGSEWSQFGPVNEIVDLSKPIDIFLLLFTEDIINKIAISTNKKIKDKMVKYKKKNNVVMETNVNEIKALIGVLIYSAAMRSNHLPVNVLFNSKYSGKIANANMNWHRCRFLLSCLCFEDKGNESIFADKFTPIKDLWGLFFGNCKTTYAPGKFVSIGEIVLPFRGRCPFKTFVANQQMRYGIRILLLIDVFSKFIVNASPYISINDTKVSIKTNMVKTLIEHLYGSHRNITIGNNYISVPLASFLLQDPYNLTVVGPLKSKIGLQKAQDKNTESQSETSMFGFSESMKLLLYTPKQNKRQFIVSTLHNQSTGTEEFENVDLLEFFKKTSNVIDVFRKNRSNCTTNRRTDSWEINIFYFILDVALNNAYAIYESNMKRNSNKCARKRDFLLLLSTQMMESWLEERVSNQNLSRMKRNEIAEILGRDLYNVPSSSTCTKPAENARRVCAYCSWKLRRMTRHYCIGCKKPICGEHNVSVCHICAEDI